MVAAHDIAKTALGLSADAILETISPRSRLELLIEEVLDEGTAATSNITDTLCLRLVDAN